MAEAKRDTIKVELEGLVCRFKIADETIELDISRCPEEIKNELMIFGAKRKVCNAAAGKSTEAAIKHMRETVDSLYSGEWNTKPSGGVKEAVKAQTISMLKGLDRNVRRAVVNEIRDKIAAAGITEEELEEILKS